MGWLDVSRKPVEVFWLVGGSRHDEVLGGEQKDLDDVDGNRGKRAMVDL